MSHNWRPTELAEVLTPVSRPEAVEPTKEYRLLGIRLDGAGPFLRETVTGSQSAATRLFTVKEGDFIYSRLFAWRGAFGVIGSDLDGCYVSGEFPTFKSVPSKIDSEFLRLWFRLPSTIEKVEADCSGSTPLTRNRFKENFFLDLEIPLAPLAEQRRIVARIEALAAKIEEARGLKEQAAKETGGLMARYELELWPEACLVDAMPLSEVTTFLARGRQSGQGQSDHYLIKTQHVQMGSYVRSKMTLAPHVAGKVAPEALVQRGDILIACSAAGCLGRVAKFDDGQKASTDTHVAIARPRTEKVTPKYLYVYLRGAQGQIQLRSRERGDWQREKIGFRLTELNLNDLQQVPVPVPPLPEQDRIVDYLDGLQAKVDALKRIQAETAAELNALLLSILDKAFKAEL